MVWEFIDSFLQIIAIPIVLAIIAVRFQRREFRFQTTTELIDRWKEEQISDALRKVSAFAAANEATEFSDFGELSLEAKRVSYYFNEVGIALALGRLDRTLFYTQLGNHVIEAGRALRMPVERARDGRVTCDPAFSEIQYQAGLEYLYCDAYHSNRSVTRKVTDSFANANWSGLE